MMRVMLGVSHSRFIFIIIAWYCIVNGSGGALPFKSIINWSCICSMYIPSEGQTSSFSFEGRTGASSEILLLALGRPLLASNDCSTSKEFKIEEIS
jgi:hypothetical protein